MHFLEYSNNNHVNIIPQEEFENLVKQVFNVIATNITKSLGPLGSSATILDGMMTEATKDGYSILMKYCFTNRYKKMIYNLICAPCTRMNNTVGDGTTTAIALTNAIFSAYEANKNIINSLYRLPRQFTQAWDDVIASIISRVESKAKPIDPEDFDTIYHLAYVTSNGNDEISRSIAEIYKNAHTPSIKQKDSPTNKSYIQEISGFEFPTDLISDTWVKNEDGTVTENNIAVMVFDYKIEDDTFNEIIAPINEVLRAMNKKLLILAPSYDTHMVSTTCNVYVNREYNSYQKFNLIMAEYKYGKLSKHQLNDLTVVLRGKLITQEIGNDLRAAIGKAGPDIVVRDIEENNENTLYKVIGESATAILSTRTGAIFHVNNIESDEKYQETMAAAKRDLEDITSQVSAERQAYATKIYDAQSRILQLEMKNYIYYIGADSALQKQITWDSIEDVIKCLRSAIKYGIVPGCQLKIAESCIEYIHELNEDNKDHHNDLKIMLTSIILQGIKIVYSQVLHGANGDGIIKTIPNWNLVTDEENQKLLAQQAIEKANKIIDESILKQKVFDLEKLDFSNDIITSAQTDTMVLMAASDLVKILISGNQCIFRDSDVTESHNDTLDAYM